MSDVLDRLESWRLLSPREVSEFLSMPLSTVYRRAQSGEIPCIKLKRSVRFSANDLKHFIVKHRRAASDD